MAREEKAARSPSPTRPVLKKNRSPVRMKEDVRDRRVQFEDERGGQLVKTIRPEQGTMRVREARQEVPRMEGESRSKWKDRIFNHLRSKKKDT